MNDDKVTPISRMQNRAPAKVWTHDLCGGQQFFLCENGSIQCCYCQQIFVSPGWSYREGP